MGCALSKRTPDAHPADEGAAEGADGTLFFDASPPAAGNATATEEEDWLQAHTAHEAFCGPPIVGSGQVGDGAAAAPVAAAAADPPVAFDAETQAATTTNDAQLVAEARARLLTPDGALAESASVFVEGRFEQEDQDVAQRQSADATGWLLAALPVAALDADIAAGIRQLLAVNYYTVNLGARKQWAPLLAGAHAVLAAVGRTQLAPLFTAHQLAERLGDARLRPLYTDHACVRTAAAAAARSQRLAMPQLFEVLQAQLAFGEPAAMAERVALHAVLLLSRLVNARFQSAMQGVAERSGCAFSGAPAKGYARSLVKLDADYQDRRSPRCASILDGLRCLLTGGGVGAVRAAIAGTSAACGGLVQLKNPFGLSEARRAERAHLLLLNLTVVFASGTTVAALLAEPAAAALLAGVRARPDGEPQERWERHFDAAVALLRTPALGPVPVTLCAEVQVTFDSFAVSRGAMHYPYDIVRAGDDGALARNFQSAGGAAAGGAAPEPEEEGWDLASACGKGQLSVATRFLDAAGADVDAVRSGDDGQTPLFWASDRGHCDVVALLVARGADPNLARTSDGATPLFMAAQKGFTHIVQQLVQAGADLNQADTQGLTPLYWPASDGHIQVVETLLAAGADPTLGAGNPLTAAKENGHTAIQALLLAAGATE